MNYRKVLYISIAIFLMFNAYHLGRIARIHEAYAEFHECEHMELSNESKEIVKKVPFDVAYHYILGIRLQCTFDKKTN